MFIDNAVPIEHKNKTAIAPLYAVLRPRVLAMGAQMKLDDPIASKTPALVTLMCSAVVPNSAAISGVAGYRHVLENVAARHMKLTVKRITYLCQLGRSMPFLCVSLAIGGGAVEASIMLSSIVRGCPIAAFKSSARGVEKVFKRSCDRESAHTTE